MNTGWSGPSPVRVVEAIKGRFDYEINHGPATPEVTAGGREIQAKAREATPQGPAWFRLTVEED